MQRCAANENIENLSRVEMKFPLPPRREGKPARLSDSPENREMDPEPTTMPGVSLDMDDERHDDCDVDDGPLRNRKRNGRFKMWSERESLGAVKGTVRLVSQQNAQNKDHTFGVKR